MLFGLCVRNSTVRCFFGWLMRRLVCVLVDWLDSLLAGWLMRSLVCVLVGDWMVC